MEGSCDHDTESLNPIKSWIFLEQSIDFQSAIIFNERPLQFSEKNGSSLRIGRGAP
jgi:hypothetical protein